MAYIERNDVVEARALIEIILWIRGVVSRTRGVVLDMAARTQIHRFNVEWDSGCTMVGNVPGVVVTCDGIGLLDGRAIDCGHVGQAHDTAGFRNTHVVYHGTKDLEGILRCNGLIHSAINTCGGKLGWFHSKSFSQAYGYAAAVNGFKVILKIHSRCFNACGRGRTWSYTKAGCTNYAIVAILLVPDTSDCIGTLAQARSQSSA